jgi:hypothetical protein
MNRLGRQVDIQKVIQVSWVIFLLAALIVLLLAWPGLSINFFQPPDLTEALSIAQSIARWTSGILSILATLLSIALSVLVFWRKPHDPMAVFFSFYLLFYALFMTGPIESANAYWIPEQPELALRLQSIFFMLPNLVLLLIFPNGRFQPRWTQVLLWLGLIFTIGALFLDPGELIVPKTLPAQLLLGLLYSLLLASLSVQIYRYRSVYSHAERQQAKWAVFGILAWLFLIGLSSIPYYYLLLQPAGQPIPAWQPLVAPLWFVALFVLPAAFTVAILRSRLWDIDFIVRRTLFYGLLTGLLASVYFGAVTMLQSFFSAAIGHQSTAALVISTLAIAALFNPLRRRVQDLIDRRFYRQKYNAENALAAFAAEARSETDLEHLADRLAGTVQEALQPEHLSLWIVAYDRAGYSKGGPLLL